MATQTAGESKDYLALHFGHCGCGFGENFWELASKEHNLSISSGEGKPLFRHYQSLLSQNTPKQYRARALFIDPDGQDISRLRKGHLKNITDTELNFLTDKEDALGNFAAGYYTHSVRILEQLNHKLAKMLESCDKTPTFVSTVSYSGGSAGVYCRVMDNILKDEFTKATHINFGLCPSPSLGKSTIDCYNFVLSQYAESWGKNSNFLRVIFDNEALYASSTRHNNTVDLGYSHVNLEVARVMSLVTSSCRFNSDSNQSADFSSLVVSPNLNYITPSYMRMLGIESDTIEFEATYPLLMEGGAMLASCPQGDVLTDTVYAKGITPSYSLQQKIEEIARDGTKFENVYLEQRSVPVKLDAFDTFQLGRLTSNRGVKEIFKREMRRFDKTFARRAFVHWYVGEGMEEGEMSEAIHHIETVYREYNEGCAPVYSSDSDGDGEDDTSQTLDEVESS